MRHQTIVSLSLGLLTLCGNACSQGWVPGSPPKYNGVSVKGQCVTFARDYAVNYLATSFPSIGVYHPGDSGAHWIYDDPRLQPTNTTRIANNGSNLPMPQDIIVWKSTLPKSQGYGHVAIVESALSRNRIVVADSNWQGDERGTIHDASSTMQYVLGWFRPNRPIPIALYRYFNVVNGDHFYSSDYWELRQGSGPYIREGNCGTVFAFRWQNAVPIYRYYNPATGFHFYTSNYQELGGGAYGYQLEGSRFNAYVNGGPVGAQPVYRYFNVVNGSHFFSQYFSELANCKYQGEVDFTTFQQRSYIF